MNALFELIIELFSGIATEAILAVLGVAGVWVLIQMGKTKKFANIEAAAYEVKSTVVETVWELQQEYVEKWKAANADGKLTDEEKITLRKYLMDIVMDKLSEPAKKILVAAGKDLVAMIRGAAEAAVLQMKQGH